jgi:hypothetical protein
MVAPAAMGWCCSLPYSARKLGRVMSELTRELDGEVSDHFGRYRLERCPRVSSCSWLYSMLAHLGFTASIAGIPRAKIERTLIRTKRAMSCSMTAFLLGTTFTGQRQAAPRSRRMIWPCMCGTHEGAMQYRTSTDVRCHQDVALSCGRFSCRCLHYKSLTPRVGPHD